MQPTESNSCRETPHLRASAPHAILLLFAVLTVAILSAGCAGPTGPNTSSSATREASLRGIAAEFARSGDLAQAQAELDKLKLANPGQLLVTLAEDDLSAGRAAEARPLTDLAHALGVESPKLVAYFAPTEEPTETASPAPPLQTPVAATTTAEPPTAVPPTDTPAPATATLEPPTVTPTTAPVSPRVIANTNANVRGGPGRTYPVIGNLRTGQEVAITGRNDNGDWWRIAWDGRTQAWVSGTTVRLQGQIDTIAVASDIPTPPPTRVPPTAPPAAPPAEAPPAEAPPAEAQPTAPPPAATGAQYVIQSVRLRSVGEAAQHCSGGDHNIFVNVTDAAGNPLNGVRVREVFSGQTYVTGDQGKGPGRVEYDIYRGGGGQIEIIGDNGERIGELSRGMSADWPPFDLMLAAGYCNCKPHPDPASCEADLNNKTYLFAVGHYAYEVVYRRTY
jgi:uncharacterized protein YraI